ncbi:hypothetical protein [Rhizobium sp. WW_1]|uniref:hypothetical protein n=1 Tax=Rhizobium sp. WW_1 TaxID=1907375 RepID=UPI00064579F6|nr:hypothetical protein [Rhizobium sp. WW_1]RKD68950.1 hypothetical protein BJ928_10488 [Rhizobium sp. WW_1]
MSDEASVTINGKQLSSAQAMTLRVAVMNFFSEMTGDPHVLGDDEHGVTMTRLYKEHCAEIIALMAR